ncbi:MAG: thiol-disulfide oxidoreductase DCC family protein [Ferruginibacter sp.]|nr:thiol-disulfide oxidoreductase DCC family protein [Ferruginibacter sp.]
MNGKPTILFDGVCNFCNSAVNFIIQRDKKALIKFAALQSGAGQKLLKQFNLPTTVFNSFIFIEEGMIYSQSAAALRLCRYLTALWPLLYGFIIVPKFIRDSIYRWIAKNRYKWFGKREQCMVPTPELRNRFLQ